MASRRIPATSSARNCRLFRTSSPARGGACWLLLWPSHGLDPIAAAGASHRGAAQGATSLRRRASARPPAASMRSSASSTTCRAQTGMAFVVVQHLSPDFRSMMDELLARHTKLPIRLVENGMLVEADRVYLIPPGKEMIISEGRLLLSERDKQQELTLPIDVFFRSLAQDCGRARGGHRPLRRRQRRFARHPRRSRGGRPGHRAGHRDARSSTGCPGRRATPASPTGSSPRSDMPRGARGARASSRRPARSESAEPRVRASSTSIYQMLEEEFGIDFTHYKPSTVTRRIERRLALVADRRHRASTSRACSAERDELDLLYRDLLIGVTRFFRNEEAFAAPRAARCSRSSCAHGHRDAPFRAWVAGLRDGRRGLLAGHHCSTRLLERSGRSRREDLRHRRAPRLARARGARHLRRRGARQRLARAASSATSAARARRYQVVPDLRQIDRLRAAQRHQGRALHARRPRQLPQPPHLPPAARAAEGALASSTSRSTAAACCSSARARAPGTSRTTTRRSTSTGASTASSATSASPVDARLVRRAAVEPRRGCRAAGRALRALLARRSSSAPTTRCSASSCPRASSSTTAASWFTRSPARAASSSPATGGRGSTSLDLVDPELKMVLVGGLKRALARARAARASTACVARRRSDEALRTRSRSGAIAGRGERRAASARVVRAGADAARARSAARETRDRPRPGVARAAGGARSGAQLTPRRTCRRPSRSSRRATRSSRRRTRSSSSSNEELQSTNEELQSVNEELYTVNAEHQRKIAELTRADERHGQPPRRAPTSGPSSSTRSSTSASSPRRSRRRFNLVPHDVGPADRDVRPHDASPRARRRPPRVLATGERVEREIRDRARRRRSSCASCPTAPRARIAGVVLTLIDVSGLKAAEDALFHERYLLDSLLFSVPDAIYFKDVAREVHPRQPRHGARAWASRDPARGGRARRRSSCSTTSRARAQAAPTTRSLRDGRAAALRAREARRAGRHATSGTWSPGCR